MMYLSLFLGSTLSFVAILMLLQKIEHIKGKDSLALFIFGLMLSIPFILVEHLHLSFYWVIGAFVLIELIALFTEHHIKPLHALISHNIKNLRILSFLIIGLGFTYGEITAFLLSESVHLQEAIAMVPLRGLYALLIHTVLTSAASITGLGTLFAESIYETVLRFVSYYARIVIVSVSHYVYILFSEHMFSYLIIPFLMLNVFFFFHYKNYLDRKALLKA